MNEYIQELAHNNHNPLYRSWVHYKRTCGCEGFDRFEDFVNLVLSLGWHQGKCVSRKDFKKPISPDNLAILFPRDMHRVHGHGGVKPRLPQLQGCPCSLKRYAKQIGVGYNAVLRAVYYYKVQWDKLEEFFGIKEREDVHTKSE